MCTEIVSLFTIIKDAYLNYTTFRWTVGIADYDENAILTPGSKLNVHWVKHSIKDSWFADPFILSETEDFIYLLVEQVFYSNNKGIISRLKIGKRGWELLAIEPIIEISTHLSFPAYFRKNGKVYIYPENTKTGKLTLYEYDESSGKAVPIRDISLSPLADAVIWQMGDKKVILATKAPNDNGRVLEAHPFYETVSPEKEGPMESISFPERIARNAGIPFEIDGRFFRPAQNCERRYGECVIIQEVIQSEVGLHFNEVNRFYSPLPSYKVAFHTFNVFEKKYIAVDAEGMRYGRLAQFLYLLREKLR